MGNVELGGLRGPLPMAGAPAWSQGWGQPDVPPVLQPCPHQLPAWGHLWMCPVMLWEQAPLVHYQKDARKAALLAFTKKRGSLCWYSS